MKVFNLVFLLVFSSCSSSIVISQKGCLESDVLLGKPVNLENLKKELIWMPKAPFSRAEFSLFGKQDGGCPSMGITPIVVKDDFLSIFFSFIPLFSQTSIFYIH
jgi:hypothetical protein